VSADPTAAGPTLESAFGDMQHFEFTVEEGQLFFLQARAGTRTPWAAVRIAADLVRAGVIASAEALRRLAPYDLDTIVRTTIRPRPADVLLARAMPAGIGVVSGRLAFDAGQARELAATGQVILARSEMRTEDIDGIHAAAGMLTTRGGRTSHAAVVARQLGKPCLVGCADLRADASTRACSIGSRLFREGDVVTLDAVTGCVHEGEIPAITERPADALAVIGNLRTQTN
jgi:pyruvate,orthophosphate dikinase